MRQHITQLVPGDAMQRIIQGGGTYQDTKQNSLPSFHQQSTFWSAVQAAIIARRFLCYVGVSASHCAAYLLHVVSGKTSPNYTVSLRRVYLEAYGNGDRVVFSASNYPIPSPPPPAGKGVGSARHDSMSDSPPPRRGGVSAALTPLV